jgi:hypothetical protein
MAAGRDRVRSMEMCIPIYTDRLCQRSTFDALEATMATVVVRPMDRNSRFSIKCAKLRPSPGEERVRQSEMVEYHEE